MILAVVALVVGCVLAFVFGRGYGEIQRIQAQERAGREIKRLVDLLQIERDYVVKMERYSEKLRLEMMTLRSQLIDIQNPIAKRTWHGR